MFSPPPRPRRAISSLLVGEGSGAGLDSHGPGTLPSRPRQRAALVVSVPCHAVIRALALPFLVRPCPRWNLLVTGCDVLRTGPESMTAQRHPPGLSFPFRCLRTPRLSSERLQLWNGINSLGICIRDRSCSPSDLQCDASWVGVVFLEEPPGEGPQIARLVMLVCNIFRVRSRSC